MKRDFTLPGVVRRARTLDMDGGFYIGDLKFQFLQVLLRNNAGVMQHLVTQEGINGSRGLFREVTDRFKGIQPPAGVPNTLGGANWMNTPTLGAAQGFVGGIGISANFLVFDTDPPKYPRIEDSATFGYYQGNVARCYLACGFTPINVLNDTRPRLAIGLYNAMTGAVQNFTVAWLGAAGNLALFTYWGFL